LVISVCFSWVSLDLNISCCLVVVAMLVMARTARENVIRECWLFVGDTAIIIKYTDVIQKLIFDRCY